MGRAALAIGLLLLGMIVFGPRASIDLEAGEVREVPEDLDALAERVAQDAETPGVIPGTEARLLFRPGARERRAWSVVYLHGFSASRQETAPLAEKVAEGLDAHLFEARFAGHGQGGAALGEATAEAWLQDAREAIRIGARLGERTVVLASSTGATFAYLAATTGTAPGVATFVFLSPNFGPVDGTARLLLWPWADTWVPLVVGRERSWEPVNEAQGRYWTTRYPIRALFPMMAAVAAARSADPRRVKAPVRIFVHPDDPVVSAEATRAVFAGLETKKALSEVTGPGDDHVLAGRILSPARTGTVARDILDWVRSL